MSYYNNIEISDLYRELKKAYTDKNLNRITRKVINLYKEKQFETIRRLYASVNNLEVDTKKQISRQFSMLIKLYHPDKCKVYNDEIEKCFQSENKKKLEEFLHILILLQPDAFETSYASVDYSDILHEMEWGYDTEDLEFFSVVNPEEEEKLFKTDIDFKNETKQGKSLFEAVKHKEYGNLNVDFELYNLTQIEGDLELSDYDIDDLFGIEYCKNLTSIDLSNNNIFDLTGINKLTRLQELYLSNNEIEDIGLLRLLRNLHILNLAGNTISDIQPLFRLRKLVFVNLIGNKIPEKQIQILRNNDVVVVC